MKEKTKEKENKIDPIFFHLNSSSDYEFRIKCYSNIC